MMNISDKAGLDLRKIAFGKTDAFNELSELGSDYFLDSFVENDKYRVSEFLDGKKYYICGKKGTGKTAFLRYLECRLKEDSENLIIPIRFKSEFDETDKAQLMGMATSDKDESEVSAKDESFSTSNILSQKSYVLMWKTFLIHQIFLHSQKGEYAVFKDNDDFKLISTLLRVLYGDSSSQGLIMPKLKRGTVEISTSIASLIGAKVKLEIDFDSNTKKANYIKLAKKIVQLFGTLVYVKTSVHILVDELELSVRNKDMHKKDIELVRDLILAIDDLNKTCNQKCYNIHLIASVRSEVVNSVQSAGFEINKCIEDYGVTVDWFQKGGDYRDNPLLKIIENKIRASEKINGANPSQDIWETYFEELIHETEVRKYILNNTWYRPRDIVRLMSLLQDQNNPSNRFTQKSFDSAQQEYSNKMWNELSEELILSYSADDLKAIKTFFNRIELPFTHNYLCDRAEQLGEIYPNVKSFFEKVSMADFLEKMFALGIIGNTGSRMVFYFFGDQDISIINPMVIHNPLRNFFAVQSKK